MEKTKNPKEDTAKLKAIAYDLMVNIQLLQNDLMNVNSKIARIQKAK